MPDSRRRGARPRKVCFVLDKLAARSGGAERVLIEAANAMAERGHRVEILSHERRGKPPFFPRRFGVVHTNLRRPDAARGKLRIRFDDWREEQHRKERRYRFPEDRIVWLSRHGSFWRRLERYLNQQQPDVAIAFLPTSVVALGMVRPRYPLHRIASLHNVPERDLCDPDRWDPNPLDRKRRMSALYRHDRITVLQPEFRDWFPEPLRRKTVIVPNVVRPFSAQQIRRRVPGKTVISIGRLADVKRHALLIDAWANIAREFPDWTLKIFGKGPLETQLDRQVSERGLAGKVLLMGHTQRIDDEYLAASIVAHPALHEGWGLAASEALAAGVPVIGFRNCPGINRLVQDRVNGLLVQDGADSVSSLATALAELMRNDSFRGELAKAAPGTVEDYAPDKVYDIWEDLICNPAPAGPANRSSAE